MNTKHNESSINIHVIVVEEDNSVYVQFAGFENITDADEYADFLQEYLPLMLFQSEIKH